MTVTHDALASESVLVGIGTNAGHPLAEHPLPFWLTAPCPAWCSSIPHTNQDTGLMRAHRSRDRSVMLSMEAGGELYDSEDPSVTGRAPKCIDLSIRQPYREAEPSLQLAFACDDEPNLTLAEGTALAALLTNLADHAGDLADETAEDRPFWLAGPCPAWCKEPHRDGDHPDDRRHAGGYHSVNLAMQDPYIAFPSKLKTGPGANWRPQYLAVALEQDWREVEPHMAIQYADDKYLALTLDEARELAADLSALVATGSEGAR